ncbi:MAG: hypothetical protein GF400_07760, partial [Candidatus Eisenbacteria bacterium]|nr:hypothetical protein [Candidatus Eisenbacteria bacterium]
MKDHCPIEEELPGFLDGALDESREEAILAHIEECDRCRRAVAELRRAAAILREAAAEEPPALENCDKWELTAAYADGSLPEGQRESAERHIAKCRACAALLADLWRPLEEAPEAGSGVPIERALAALGREARTAVVCWRDGAASVIRRFASD